MLGSAVKPEFRIPYRNGSQDYKIHYIKGDCGIECVSDMCLTTVVPNVCSAKLQSDAECKRDDECENKSCINKKCQEKIVDKSVQDCMADMECQSGICNQFTKKCGLNDVNQECHRHKECTTGYCRSKTKKCDNKP